MSQEAFMTSEVFYKQFFLENLYKERDARAKSFQELSNFPPISKFDVISLVSRETELKMRILKVKEQKISQIDIDVKSMMNNYFKNDIANRDREVALIKQKALEKERIIESKKESTIKSLEQSLAALENQYEKAVSDIKIIQSRLKGKVSLIRGIMGLYNIPLRTGLIDYSNLSLDDIRSLALTSEEVISNMSSRNVFLEYIMRALYLPSVLNIKEDSVRVVSKVIHIVSLIVLCIFFKPYIMGVFGIFYLTFIVSNILQINDRKELLQFSYEVSCDLDLDKFFTITDEYKEVTEKLEKAKAYDLTPFYAQIERESEEQIFAVEDKYKIEDKREELQTLYNQNSTRMAPDVSKAFGHIKNQKSNSCAILEQLLKETRMLLDEACARCKPLGTTTSSEPFLTPRLRIAYTPKVGNKIDELSLELEMKNMVYLYDSPEQKVEQIEHIQFQLVNYYSNVKYKKLSVTIFDEMDLGRDFSDFKHDDLRDIFEIETTNIQKVLGETVSTTKENVAKIGRQSIAEYNKAAAAKKMITIDYRLLIVVSSNTNLLSDEVLVSLMNYSASAGYLVWLLLPQPEKKEDISKYERLCRQNIYLSSEPYHMGAPLEETLTTTHIEDDGLDWGNVRIPKDYEEYRYSPELGRAIMESLAHDCANDPGDTRLWEETYRDVVYPKEKLWTATTQNGINIRLGFRDGDPSKHLPLTLCDAPVHALCAGASGAGKSATANQILGNLLHEYPPTELELIMIDFKNAEFPMYTKKANPNFDPALGKRDPDKIYFDEDPNPEFIYMSIPHAKLISGTKDGEYALSIFDYLNKEMARRSSIFRRYNTQNIADYNKLARKGKTAEGIMPRILLFIDEFTVMFNDIPAKILAKIETAIISLANLARFCGCHMWFQTQEFSGTIPKKVMNQFSLRVCLRAASNVADDVMKSKLPPLLPKRGQCYSNESMGEDQSTTKRWVIPFLDGNVMNNYMPKLSKWAAGELNGTQYIDRQPSFYDEDRKHIVKEIGDWHAEFYEELASSNRAILLGEPTIFDSENVLPVNFKLTRDDCENVILQSDSRASLCYMVNTMYHNAIAKEKKPIIIMNVQDKDNYKLLDTENKVEEKWLALANPRVDFNTIMEILETIVASRQTKSLDEIETPVFLFLVNWEKMVGIGREQRPANVSRLTTLLRDAPMVNIHFFFFTKQANLFRELVPLFNHRICGKTDDTKILYLLIDEDKSPDFGFAVYKKSDDRYKFKVYYSQLLGEVEETKVVVKSRNRREAG